jgi:hypothetical protein
MLVEVAGEAMANDCNPIMCIQLGMIYGMVLGVNLEQEKARRGAN